MAAPFSAPTVALLARTYTGLCEGQVRELERTGNLDQDQAGYFTVIEKKTASSIRTSARLRKANTGGADANTVEAANPVGSRGGNGVPVDRRRAPTSRPMRISSASLPVPDICRGHIHVAGDRRLLIAVPRFAASSLVASHTLTQQLSRGDRHRARRRHTSPKFSPKPTAASKPPNPQ